MLQSTISVIDVTSVSVQRVSTQSVRTEDGVKRRNITRGYCLDIRNGSLQVLCSSLNFKLETSRSAAIGTLHRRSNARFHQERETKASTSNTKVIQ